MTITVESKRDDWVSPGLNAIFPDDHFPHLIKMKIPAMPWKYARANSPHRVFFDRRFPGVGFLNRDESILLFNLAQQFKGMKGVEIGVWTGWSTFHIASAGIELDSIDPILGETPRRLIVEKCLESANLRSHVNLVPEYSPVAISALADRLKRQWSFALIDGNHEDPYPLEDAKTLSKFMSATAIIVFHDLLSPDVTKGLQYLADNGWNTMVALTSQIMGIAWRGDVTPVKHIPDPRVIDLGVPGHLRQFKLAHVD